MGKHLSGMRTKRSIATVSGGFMKPREAISLRGHLEQGRVRLKQRRAISVNVSLTLTASAAFAAFAIFGFTAQSNGPRAVASDTPTRDCTPVVGQTYQVSAPEALGGIAVSQVVCGEKKYRLVVDATRRQILQVISL